jgi:hypothetical protein
LVPSRNGTNHPDEDDHCSPVGYGLSRTPAKMLAGCQVENDRVKQLTQIPIMLRYASSTAIL